MTGLLKQRHPLRVLLLGVGLLMSVGLAGCQSYTGGQTLPSPYYMTNNVQYFPPGSEFKLAREAAAQKAYNQEQAQQQAPQR